MALPTYPPAMPAPSPNIKMLERGQQNYFFTNAVATNAPGSNVSGFGNTGGAPTGSVVYGIPVSKGVEGALQDYVLQIDSYGASATQGPSAVVVVYGSLDNVLFYPIYTATTVTTTGALVFLAKQVTPGIKIRYITAGITVYAGSGGTTDSVTASIYGG